MKKILAFLMLYITAGFVFSQSYDEVLRKLVNAMSLQYKNKVQEDFIKPTVSIVPFTNNTDEARKYNIGNLLRDKLTKLLSLSTVFVLVERDNLDKQLAEIELSLSGITEGKTPVKPAILDVQYLFAGSITEAGESFVLTVRLIQVTTSAIIFSDSVELSKAELIAEYETIRRNISQYGLGLEESTCMIYLLSEHEKKNEKALPQPLNSFFIIYRPISWIVVGLGMEFSFVPIRFSQDGSDAMFENFLVPVSSIKNMDTSTWPSDVTAIKYKKEFNYTLFGGMAGVTLMIMPELFFNISSYLTVGDVTITDIYLDIPHPDNSSVLTTFSVIQKSDDLFIVSPYVRLQWFFSKRISLNINYLYRIQLKKDIEFLPPTAGAYTAQTSTFPDCWNLNATMTPLGEKHFFDLTGHYCFLGLGVYF